MTHRERQREATMRARTTIFVMLILLLMIGSAPALAGQATVTWTNAPGIAATEVGIGTCAADGSYAADASTDYPRVPPDKSSATIFELAAGAKVCFRVRHVYPTGSASPWVFVGSKLIPPGPEIGPVVQPPPAPPTSGGVS